MNRKLGSIAAAAAIGLAALLPSGAAKAQTAYATSFQTSITYQNVGSGNATIQFNFYPENNGTPTAINRTLAAGAGSSLFVGNLTELASFRSGSVAINSDQPIVATAVQIAPSASTVKGRLLSNGSDTGNARQLIATVLKNRFNAITKFSVQNTGTVQASGVVRFFDAQNGGAEVTAARQTITNLPVGAARYFDAGAIAALPTGFNGSASVEMTTGQVFASALELTSDNTGRASAFEGTTGGSNTVYMPTAQCRAFNAEQQSSSYAIQNTGTTTANVTVRYTTTDGQTINKSLSVPAGAKGSAVACTDGFPAGKTGSAVITSTGGQIVAVAKIYSEVANSGLYTSALGANSGARRLALPYVRWSQTQYTTGARQRAFIAVQNVGSALAAGQVTVRYVDKNGNTVGTTSLGALAQGAKLSVNPSQIGAAGNEFGYYSDGSFGGSAIVEGPAGSQLTAVVRVASQVGGKLYAEDYNGIPIQ